MLFKSSLVLVFLCGLTSIAKATTCTTSINPCLTTLNIVNTCDGSACTCSDTSTMSAIDTGCATTTYLGQATLTAGIYSGECFAAQTIDLTCAAPTTVTLSSSATYKWFKAGVEQTGTTTATLTHTCGGTDNIDFTCQVVDGGLTSTASTAFNVLGYVEGGTIARSPVIGGVFTSVVTGNNMVLTCTNIPKDTLIEYVWQDGTKDGDLTLTTFTGQSLTCAVAAKTGRTFASIAAQATGTAPAAFTTAAALFTAVSIYSPAAATTLKDGVSTNILCKPTPDSTTAKYTDTTDIAWVWKKDGTAIASQTTTTLASTAITGGAGTYQITCEGTPTSGTALVSTALAITLSTTVFESAKVYISPTVSSTATVIVGNYMAVRCIVAAPSITGISYSWTYNTQPVVGNVDNTLLIYGVVDATHGANQNYVCTATIGDYVETATGVGVTATAVASATPSITSSKTTTSYGTGDSYVLTCALTSNSESFGLTYKWFSAGTEVSGETASTYTITATGTSTAYTCKATHGGTDTLSSSAETVAGVELTSQTVTFALSPVQTLSYDFVCSVTTSASAGAVTYVWKKDGTSVGTAATYTVAAFATANDGAYTCDATAAGGNTLTSTSATVTSVTTPATPTVTIPAITNTGGSYTLTCASASVTTDTVATYEWSLAGSVIAGETSSTYTIASLASANGGSYTCKVTVNSVQSTASTGVTLTVGTAFGLPCTNSNYATTCTTDFTKYTGNCINSYCECASGVSLTQDACGASAGAHVIASVMTVLLAVLGTLAM